MQNMQNNILRKVRYVTMVIEFYVAIIAMIMNFCEAELVRNYFKEAHAFLRDVQVPAVALLKLK
jgi:hypothetical protein